MKMEDFELVQVHEGNGRAEIVVRDKNSRKVYAGNLTLVDNPAVYYPPGYPKVASVGQTKKEIRNGQIES